VQQPATPSASPLPLKANSVLQQVVTPPASPLPLKANNVVNQHNSSDFATRLMNISVLDMKALPPLLSWLDAAPLSSVDQCIADLKARNRWKEGVYQTITLCIRSQRYSHSDDERYAIIESID
jgi:hypothetical protein